MGRNVHKYLLTLFNYHHHHHHHHHHDSPSPSSSSFVIIFITMILPVIVIFDKKISSNWFQYTENGVTLSVSANGRTTLDSWSNFQWRTNTYNDNDPNHWDNAILISRWVYTMLSFFAECQTFFVFVLFLFLFFCFVSTQLCPCCFSYILIPSFL